MDEKIINVQLDFNISKKIHSSYNSFFFSPPKGIEYKKSEFKIINKKNYSTLGKIYKKAVSILPFLNKFHQIINDALRKENHVDLIYFVNHLGKTDKLFVADYEHAYNFIDGSDPYNEQNKKVALKRLSQKGLKYLLPINKEALKSFNLFFNGLKTNFKQEVLYPTNFIAKEYRKKVNREKIIVFIGSSNINTDEAFYIKGGCETLKAFEDLSEKYPKYSFMIISKIPKEIGIKPKKNLIIKDIIPQKELWKILNKAQIFVQPNYNAPAMAYIEAMFFRLPIVTYNKWANNEYVDNLNGILVTPKSVKNINEYNVPFYSKETFNQIKSNAKDNAEKIKKAIIRLIENPKLREKMGKEGYKRVTKGKFSIKKRNEKLLKVYKEVLNNG